MKTGAVLDFVMQDLSFRPLIVVTPWSDEMVNGVLLFDGSNDNENFPEGTLGGMVTLPNTGGHGITLSGLHSAWVTSVHVAKVGDDPKPGTCVAPPVVALDDLVTGEELERRLGQQLETVKQLINAGFTSFARAGRLQPASPRQSEAGSVGTSDQPKSTEADQSPLRCPMTPVPSTGSSTETGQENAGTQAPAQSEVPVGSGG